MLSTRSTASGVTAGREKSRGMTAGCRLAVSRAERAV